MWEIWTNSNKKCTCQNSKCYKRDGVDEIYIIDIIDLSILDGTETIL